MKSKLLLATSIFAIFALNGCLDQVTEAPDMSALACTTEPLDDDSGLKIICGGDSVGIVLNGKDGKDGKDGKNGKEGKSGADGKNGSDGTSCRVVENKDIDGFEVFCGDKKVGELKNGKDGADGKNGSDGSSCRVEENSESDGYDVFCGDKKVGELKNGKDGADGKNGKDGSSCRIVESKDIDGFEVFCGDEKVGELRNGKDGADGKNGSDGSSCRVEENSEGDGYDVFCGDKKVGELKNGKDGADGKDGKDGASCRIVESKDIDGFDIFCGDEKVGELRNGKDGADGKDTKPVEILSNACNVLRTTTDMFSSMYDVFYCLRPNEKVAFILRHAARDRNNTGTNGSLNQTGIDQSTQVGQKLKKLNIDDFFYMHTNVYRTQQTARIISENKGQTTGSEDEWKNTTSNEYHAQNMDLLESWYIRNDNRKKDCQGQNSWGWSIYSKVAYEEYDKKNNSDSENKAACEDALYNIEERTQEFISTYFTYDNMHKMTLAISHDQFLVPFVIAISHKKIHDDSNYTLQFHKHENNFNYWINYLTGVAIIVDPDNNTTVIPVTALDDGFLRSY